MQQAGIALQIGQAGGHPLMNHTVQVTTGLRQHGLCNDKLAHQVDQLIDFLDRHSDRGTLQGT